MKLQIENLTVLFLISALLLTGCSGYSVKTAQRSMEPEHTPLDKSPRVSKPTQQEVDIDTEQTLNPNARSPLIFQRKQGHALYPFTPVTISKGLEKLADAEIKSRLAKLKKSGDYSEFEYEETIWEGMDSVYEEALGTLRYAQYYCYQGRPYRAYPFAAKALAANPNDFEALLTWVYTYEHNREPHNRESYNRFDDAERVIALRRLQNMNPNHPYVLQELARAIYPVRPTEALGYAKKALQLDYRYSREGLDGVCYFQSGDYKKALSVYERVYADADADS